MQTIKQLLIVGTISCLLLVDCDWLVVVGVGLFGRRVGLSSLLALVY